MLPAAIRSLAEQVIVLDARGDRGQVSVAGAGVAISHSLPAARARADHPVLREALERALGRELDLEPRELERLVRRLVVLEEWDAHGDVRVCGSELHGVEDLQTATARALSMRAVLIAELQRALAGDEPPATVRRSAPISSLAAR